jgi:hypothetical protein
MPARAEAWERGTTPLLPSTSPVSDGLRLLCRTTDSIAATATTARMETLMRHWSRLCYAYRFQARRSHWLRSVQNRDNPLLRCRCDTSRRLMRLRAFATLVLIGAQDAIGRPPVTRAVENDKSLRFLILSLVLPTSTASESSDHTGSFPQTRHDSTPLRRRPGYLALTISKDGFNLATPRCQWHFSLLKRRGCDHERQTQPD